MAKKKSAAKKAPSRKASPKKPARKSAPARAKSKPTARRSAGRAEGREAGGGGGRGGRQPNPAPITTGSGPTPSEIGRSLVEMFNAGQIGGQIEDKWWSPDIVSVEGAGVSMAWTGRDAVEAKGRSWMETHIIHGASAEGPYVGATGFAVKFRMDVEDKTTGTRQSMEEIGVYTVQNGKIIREEFMYSSAG